MRLLAIFSFVISVCISTSFAQSQGSHTLVPEVGSVVLVKLSNNEDLSKIRPNLMEVKNASLSGYLKPKEAYMLYSKSDDDGILNDVKKQVMKIYPKAEVDIISSKEVNSIYAAQFED